MKAPAGLTVLHRLREGAAALVSNLAPGATGRPGLSPAELDERLRTCGIVYFAALIQSRAGVTALMRHSSETVPSGPTHVRR